MKYELDWFPTPIDAENGNPSGFVYRAIRVDPHKGAYVLISANYPGHSGKTDITRITFNDPNVLVTAIERLRADRKVYIEAKGSVTKSHEEWDHLVDPWWDTSTPDITEMGIVGVFLTLDHEDALAPFTCRVQIEEAVL